MKYLLMAILVCSLYCGCTQDNKQETKKLIKEAVKEAHKEEIEEGETGEAFIPSTGATKAQEVEDKKLKDTGWSL